MMSLGFPRPIPVKFRRMASRLSLIHSCLHHQKIQIAVGSHLAPHSGAEQDNFLRCERFDNADNLLEHLVADARHLAVAFPSTVMVKKFRSRVGLRRIRCNYFDGTACSLT